MEDNPSDNIDTAETDTTKPWERSKRLHKEDVSGKVSITVSNLLYILTDNLKPRIQNQIRRIAAFRIGILPQYAIGLSIILTQGTSTLAKMTATIFAFLGIT